MKLRLMTRMILCILVPALFGIAVLTYVASQLAQQGMRRQIDEDLLQNVTIQARELDNIAANLLSATDSVAKLESIREYLEAVHAKNVDLTALQAPDALDNLKDVSGSFSRISEIGLADIDGNVLLSSNEVSKNTNVKNQPYFKDVLQGKKGTATLVSADKNIRVVFYAPVITSEKQMVGVALSTLDMEQLAKSTIDLIKLARTGVCYVYDREGRTIMHPNRSLIGDDNKTHPWTWIIMRDPDEAVHYEWNGVYKLAYTDVAPTLEWRVVIAADEADLLSAVSELNKALYGIGGGLILLVGIIIFLISRNIARSLAGGAAFTNYVAHGNLTLTREQEALLAKDSSREDEIGELAQGIGKLVKNLSRMVLEAEERSKKAEEATQAATAAKAEADAATRRAEGAKREGMLAAAAQLDNAVHIISSASTQLSAQIAQSEKGSSAQAARITETATAMEQMNSTVLEVARNAGSAADVSGTTRQKAESGANVVQQSVNRIRDVQTKSLSLKGDMDELNQQAQAISQIMSVISDIADQTNLLALNAAIEAARAGEAGRGFAVVADEVRKLAEKTMTSTTDVGNAIRAIQQSAAKSMAQVDDSVSAIEEAALLVNQSGSALQEIVQLVDNTADQVRAIATAVEEQSASSDEINRSITEVNGIAVETATAMREANKAVTDLNKQSQVLSSLIGEMKRG